MEEKTYTINIRQTGTILYGVSVPETGVTKTAATLNSDLTITLQDIVKHLTTHYLILVFVDQHFDEKGWFVDPRERPPTYLEQQAVFEAQRLGIAPHVHTRERHLVFELWHPLAREHVKWFDEQGKLFDWYYTKDKLEVGLNELEKG